MGCSDLPVFMQTIGYTMSLSICTATVLYQ